MKRLSKARLFFLELVADLIFFFLCAAICLTLLHRAMDLSRDSSDLSHATILAENTAELFRASHGDPTAVAAKLGADDLYGRLLVYYDENWQPVSAGAGTFFLELTVLNQPALAGASIRVCRVEADAASIFSIDTYVYTGEVIA